MQAQEMVALLGQTLPLWTRVIRAKMPKWHPQRAHHAGWPHPLAQPEDTPVRPGPDGHWVQWLAARAWSARAEC